MNHCFNSSPSKRALPCNLSGYTLSNLPLQQTFQPTVIKPHKSVRFNEELTIRFDIFGEEETYFDRNQLIQERNDSISFSTHLMITALGIDISHNPKSDK